MNFFWGGSQSDRKIAWIKWEKVLYSKKHGGLVIGSLEACNLAMLSKWWWRFKTEPNALCRNIIKSIHGSDGGLENMHALSSGTWSRIIKLRKNLSSFNIEVSTLFKKKIGNGRSTSFWNDTRVGGAPLKSTYDRLYALETEKCCTVSDRLVTQGLEHPIVTGGPGLSSFGCWAWRRPIRSGPEATQWADLLELLSQMGLSSIEDSWACCFGDCSHFVGKKHAEFD